MDKEQITQTAAECFKTQPVVKAWLFGSYSRGEETPDSDIDILVRYDDNAKISLLYISHLIGLLRNGKTLIMKAVAKTCQLLEKKKPEKDEKCLLL